MGHLTLVMKTMIGLKPVPTRYLWAFMSAIVRKHIVYLHFLKY